MKKDPRCEPCILNEQKLCTGFMQPEGKGSRRLLVIAEALGEKEEQAGLPLRPEAQAGSVFARALRQLSLDRSELVISNMVWGRPKGNKLEGEWYEQEAIDSCHKYNRALIDRTRPRAILALGNVPLKHLTGFSGKDKTIMSVRGYVLPSLPDYYLDGQPIPVVPTLHPAFIARGADSFFGTFMWDIAKALKVASGKLKLGEDYILDPSPETMPQYNCFPDHSQIRDFLDRCRQQPELTINYDIETDYYSKKREGDESEYDHKVNDRIIQIQFSIAPGSGIALPWTNSSRDAAIELLLLQNPKCGHNVWLYDKRRLRRDGIVVAGRHLDTRWMWHHSQPDLPADLQSAASFYGMPFPWKHMNGQNLQFYGIGDTDATARIVEKLPQEMQSRGIWGGYLEMVEKLRPILEGMENRGIWIHPERKEQLRGEIEVEKAAADEELQRVVPDVLKPRHPKNGYKVWPKEARDIKHHWTNFDSESLREEITRVTGLKWEMFGDTLRPVMIEPFLPNSTAHVKNLILHYGEKVPKNLDGDETTGKGELRKLIETLRANKVKYKDAKRQELASLLERVLEYRALNKIESTYIDGWPTGEDGRVHTTFTFGPATGQLGSVEPNVQNGPAHGALAERFKRIQVASPGCTLISADYSAFHLKTCGFEAEDETYIKMADIDGHSFVTAHIIKNLVPLWQEETAKKHKDLLMSHLGVSDDKRFQIYSLEERMAMLGEARKLLADLEAWPRMNDRDLTHRLLFVKKNFKDVRDRQGKPSLLGVQLTLQAPKLFEMNRKGFKSKAEAQAVIDLILKKLYPKVAQYQKNVLELAARQGYLVSRYGFIRYFYGVAKWNARSGEWIKGEEAASAVSFYVQNDAFGKMREAMRDMHEADLDRKYGMINNIHDSAVFDCPNEFLDEAVPTIQQIMEAPARKLVNKVAPKGLSCKVEIKVGPDLASLKLVEEVRRDVTVNV